ncbi:Leucine--tRNA ligase [Labeo rohita]|uniref:Leucine--tRNA ligase n=1 Tax=Labeo rohita TaxID=84645 RepID=A0ABQ8LFN4_LABRO|nr:Leucine--tRNA ligase [Labeo rohita]
MAATECMARRLSARQSDARMLGCTDPLARYDSVSPGCSYWPSDQEENCHDGCIKHGLGSRMRRQASLRDVDRNGEVLAHKLSGAPCCTPSARVLSPGHPPPSRSHQDGQYDSGGVYKSPRRCELAATDAASERPPFVGLLSIRAVHVPGRLNHSADLLSRGGVIHGEWRLKVYVAAIAAFHALVDNRTIGKNDLVIRFLKGARRLNPPRPSTLPTWDLALVLDALTGPPFEPIQSVSLRALSLKTALLLALASVKRVGDLQALSIDDSCIEFGPGDCKLTLKPRKGYVPKVLSTPFKAQVITLSAFRPETSAEPGTPDTLLCPVRAVRTYIERSREFRLLDQLFVCFGGRTKGLPVSKQRLSHWIVDAVALAYSSKGVECPIGVCAHSTRGLASSWAWANGISIQDICTAVGWSSPSTFARFYNLDVSSLASHVLSVRTAQAAHPFT